MGDKNLPLPSPWEGLPEEALAALAPQLPALAVELIEAIRAEVPSFGRPLEGEFGEIVRGGVEQALLQFEEMARNPGIGRAVGRSVTSSWAGARCGRAAPWTRCSPPTGSGPRSPGAAWPRREPRPGCRPRR